MSDELLKYIKGQLAYIGDKLLEIKDTVYVTAYTIESMCSEEKDEESTIEDEIMSCLKDLINDNDLFKNVKIKVVKVDEDDE